MEECLGWKDGGDEERQAKAGLAMALSCPQCSMAPVSGDHEFGGVPSLKNDGLDPVGETLKPIATGPNLVN